MTKCPSMVSPGLTHRTLQRRQNLKRDTFHMKVRNSSLLFYSVLLFSLHFLLLIFSSSLLFFSLVLSTLLSSSLYKSFLLVSYLLSSSPAILSTLIFFRLEPSNFSVEQRFVVDLTTKQRKYKSLFVGHHMSMNITVVQD